MRGDGSTAAQKLEYLKYIDSLDERDDDLPEMIKGELGWTHQKA